MPAIGKKFKRPHHVPDAGEADLAWLFLRALRGGWHQWRGNPGGDQGIPERLWIDNRWNRRTENLEQAAGFIIIALSRPRGVKNSVAYFM